MGSRGLLVDEPEDVDRATRFAGKLFHRLGEALRKVRSLNLSLELSGGTESVRY